MRVITTMVAFSCFLHNSTAIAEEYHSDFSVGLSVINAPKYSGSNEQHWMVAPELRLQYGHLFVDSTDGVGFRLESENGWYMESSLNYAPGRTDKNTRIESGSDRLRGMGKIDSTVSSRMALGWAATDWLAFEAEANAPISDSQGLHYRTSTSVMLFANTTDWVSLDAGILFGDSRYINTWYGVNKKQSAHSGFRQYNTSGGIFGYDASLVWAHKINDNWSTMTSYNYTRLSQKASDSPIVERRYNSMISAGLIYSF
ncbi:MipA/OmpV family protein [Citrobacter sp. JGM124]|uniref:MipA/OmpV family protein n=1 Tax=Citrobacter sp. JGM124 TaxID=2799789 RepID=UPI001BA88284|nr:MipA/OmpV family protein [Citrobacter sp. JGM124]MBS0849281.1 MipA/OmpV family protein [Citrobacter sp. JGM124]